MADVAQGLVDAISQFLIRSSIVKTKLPILKILKFCQNQHRTTGERKCRVILTVSKV